MLVSIVFDSGYGHTLGQRVAEIGLRVRRR